MKKLEDNKELIPLLQEAGISAKEYANPNQVGIPGTFVMGTSSAGRGLLIRNTPAAKIEVATDKDKRQAVLNVTEEKLNVKRKVKATLSKRKVNEGYNQRSALINAFPVYIPGASFTVNAIKESKNTDGGVTIEGDVKATTGRARQTCFLVGMDETSHFISVLPHKVDTVEEAHAALKPKDLPQVEGIKRQGEFFFVPVSAEVVEEFLRTDKKKGIRRSVPLERGSSHTAQYAVPISIRSQNNGGGWRGMNQSERYPKGVHFVKGLIFDKRGYRHEPLDLGEQWHRVVRNEEKKPPQAVARRYD